MAKPSQEILNLINEKAKKYGIPPKLFYELIRHESGFNPRAVSPAGAMGLGQLMPSTARALGVKDPFDPEQNLEGAARYLRQQYDRFGSWELALAAYNAGPGAVQKYGGIPPYRETQKFVSSIMAAVGNLADSSVAIAATLTSRSSSPKVSISRIDVKQYVKPPDSVRRYVHSPSSTGGRVSLSSPPRHSVDVPSLKLPKNVFSYNAPNPESLTTSVVGVTEWKPPRLPGEPARAGTADSLVTLPYPKASLDTSNFRDTVADVYGRMRQLLSDLRR